MKLWDKIKENPILDYTTKYLEENKDIIVSKKPKEILNDIIKGIKK